MKASSSDTARKGRTGGHPAGSPGSGIRMLPVGSIRPNGYNPNEMDKKDLADYAAEVARLKRLPRPLVVRPSGKHFILVDGEHGLKAARKARLKAVPCEVIDVDDFEAQRQSYQRNRHGAMNPVKLGLMFQTMIKDRGLSNRDLGKEIGTADGTVRNYLAYAEAFKARNGRVPRGAMKRVAGLSVKQVRHYLELPDKKRDAWLDAGAELAKPKQAACTEAAVATAPAALKATGQDGDAKGSGNGEKGGGKGGARLAPVPEDGPDRLREAWGQAGKASRKAFLSEVLREAETAVLARKLLAQPRPGRRRAA